MSAPTPPPPAPAGPLSPDEDKLWASLAHFGGVLGILPSLIIWLVFKDRGARTNVEGKEALNWQITVLIIVVPLAILLNIIVGVTLSSGAWGVAAALSGLVGFIYFAVWVANAIFSILGGVKVQGGGAYRYPFNFRFIK